MKTKRKLRLVIRIIAITTLLVSGIITKANNDSLVLREILVNTINIVDLSRNDQNGMYLDRLNLDGSSDPIPYNINAGISGLFSELLKVELQLCTKEQALQRTILFMESLNGKTPDFNLKKNINGFPLRSFDENGEPFEGCNEYTTINSAILSSLLLYVNEYYDSDELEAEIREWLFSINWESARSYKEVHLSQNYEGNATGIAEPYNEYIIYEYIFRISQTLKGKEKYTPSSLGSWGYLNSCPQYQYICTNGDTLTLITDHEEHARSDFELLYTWFFIPEIRDNVDFIHFLTNQALADFDYFSQLTNNEWEWGFGAGADCHASSGYSANSASTGDDIVTPATVIGYSYLDNSLAQKDFASCFIEIYESEKYAINLNGNRIPWRNSISDPCEQKDLQIFDLFNQLSGLAYTCLPNFFVNNLNTHNLFDFLNYVETNIKTFEINKEEGKLFTVYYYDNTQYNYSNVCEWNLDSLISNYDKRNYTYNKISPPISNEDRIYDVSYSMNELFIAFTDGVYSYNTATNLFNLIFDWFWDETIKIVAVPLAEYYSSNVFIEVSMFGSKSGLNRKLYSESEFKEVIPWGHFSSKPIINPSGIAFAHDIWRHEFLFSKDNFETYDTIDREIIYISDDNYLFGKDSICMYNESMNWQWVAYPMNIKASIACTADQGKYIICDNSYNNKCLYEYDPVSNTATILYTPYFNISNESIKKIQFVRDGQGNPFIMLLNDDNNLFISEYKQNGVSIDKPASATTTFFTYCNNLRLNIMVNDLQRISKGSYIITIYDNNGRLIHKSLSGKNIEVLLKHPGIYLIRANNRKSNKCFVNKVMVW